MLSNYIYRSIVPITIWLVHHRKPPSQVTSEGRNVRQVFYVILEAHHIRVRFLKFCLTVVIFWGPNSLVTGGRNGKQMAAASPASSYAASFELRILCLPFLPRDAALL